MTPRSAPHLRGLDGLRALAVLAVLLWHCALAAHMAPAALGPLRAAAYLGWAGVDVFFALSGFLITSLLLREEALRRSRDATASFALGRFYVRRALRILPVFYAVFALCTVGIGSLGATALFRSVRPDRVAHEAFPFGLWPYATFWSNYFHAWAPSQQLRPVTPGGAYMVFWSLCVEEHFYLLWPPLLRLLRSHRARVALCLTVCLALPLVRWAVVAYGLDTLRAVHMVSHYRFDTLLWGALAALVADHPRLDDLPRRTLLAAATTAALTLYSLRALSVVPVGTAMGFGLGLGLLGLASALLVLEVVRRPDTRLVRALDLPPVAALGRWSYAMYLVHFPALDLARALYPTAARPHTPTTFFVLFALTTALTAALAATLHALIERPFLRLKDRLAA